MTLLSTIASLDLSVFQLTITSVVVYIAFHLLLSKTNLPRDLPWVGVKSTGLFKKRKAAWAAISNVTNWLGEGYQKYGKLGKSFILPTFNGYNEIVIPNSKLKWLLEHDDKTVSVSAAHYETLAGDYAWESRHILGDPYHEHVIHKNIARKIAGLIPKTWDEIEYIVPKELGSSTEWRGVEMMSSLQTMVAAISNRMFVGLPLCREQKFLDWCGKYANDIGLYTGLWSFVPVFLRPVMGPILAIPNHWHARKVRPYTMPLVKERLALYAYNDEHPEDPKEVPDDYISWHINTARAENNLFELQAEMICQRILPIEFAALHTTTFTFVNTLLDILSADPKYSAISELREEAERVFKSCNGKFDKPAIAKMVRADSAIRESMRVSAFMTTSVQRVVTSPEGLHSESEGWTAPKNAFVSVNLWTRQHDPDFYPDPWTYDPFRFSRQVEASSSYLEGAKLSFVATNENFLTFGHGKHACPGRFFVNQELKLLLAYILMNYDLEPIENRPENVKIGSALIPPKNATMRFKKRTNSIVS